MTNSSKVAIRRLLVAFLLLAGACCGVARGEEREVPLTITGGHDIGPDDFGRPVYLIAGALGVKPEQFREAFKNVKPARGREPTGEEQRKNKEALMKVLRPLGVTNERLDEVANYYRFRPQEGERWPTKPAKGHAVVEDGKVKKLVITDPGAGYNTPPRVTIADMGDVRIRATLAFDKELKKNGGVASAELAPAEPKR